jgi:hypothetical protein
MDDLVAGLESGDPEERAETLWAIARSPTGRADLLPRLEALLADEAICVVSLPRYFGEVRWAAAHALAAERKAQKIAQPITVKAVLKPIASDALHAARTAAGVPLPKTHGVAAERELVEALRALGKLERYDLSL